MVEQEWAKWIKLRPDMNLELGEFIVMSLQRRRLLLNKRASFCA